MSTPILLDVTCLGDQQRQFNSKVNLAAAGNAAFEEIIKGTEHSDLDRIFKIDLASKCKNVDYIIDTLKCGDSLYISRALKCAWLYDGEHSNIVNPDYLHHNVFPFMSIKMKNKLLTAISMHVRDEKRAEDFYHYCMKARLCHFAFKYLIFTSFDFKADMIQNKSETLRSLICKKSDIQSLVRNDILLAEYYLQKQFACEISEILHNFRYLYFVDAEKYLNWLEKHWDSEVNRSKYLGRRISKDVATKHKNRISRNVPLYCTLLNRDVLARHSTVEQAKQYIVALLPDDVNLFWKNKFCKFYKLILDIIPLTERYHCIKKIFNEKYPEQEFEMSREFFDGEYYNLMSVEERESWALRHLVNKQSIINLNPEDDDLSYLWYKFINFDAAMEAIKKLILITPDSGKRANILSVLVESAQNQSELEKLLNYYYQRHVNESRTVKEGFLLKVMRHHNVFEFSVSCWTAFEKLLYSIEVYNKAEHNYNSQDFLQASMVYHVINDREFPKSMKDCFKTDSSALYHLKQHFNRLNIDNKDKVYQYLLRLFGNKIMALNTMDYNNDIQFQIRSYLTFITDLKYYLRKTKEELPNIFLKYMKLDSRFFNPEEKKLKQCHLLRFLKEDASLVIDKLDQVKHNIENDPSFRLNIFLKKLKIYFPSSVGQKYLDFFTQSVSEECNHRLVYTSVYGIFQLADETFKSKFLMKYAPTDPKIDYSTINRHHLYIQEAICRFACYSRPPIPLSNMLQYLTGDYVKYCLPMFDFYLSSLPQAQCVQFVESLLNSPLSIQKHALRLAFHCYDVGNLKNLVQNVWNKSKNISLRSVIYFGLYRVILYRDEQFESELFKIILDLTSDLNENDHIYVMDVVTDGITMPQKLRGVYLETVWNTVSKFSDSSTNLNWKCNVIISIESNIDLMDFNAVRLIVDDYLQAALTNEKIVPDENKIEFERINQAKLRLTLIFIVICCNKGNIDTGKELVNLVLTKCIETWNETYTHSISKQETYFSRVYCTRFINGLLKLNYNRNITYGNFTAINDIIKLIWKRLIENVPINNNDVYYVLWNLRLALITNALASVKNEESSDDKLSNGKEVIKSYANKVIQLVEEFIDVGLFIKPLVEIISGIIYLNMENLSCALGYNEYLDYFDIKTIAGTEFLNSKREEIVLLGNCMMPILLEDK